MAMRANKPFFPLKSHPLSTCILLWTPDNKVVDWLIPLVTLLFLLLPLNLKAQLVLDNSINIRVNDPAVTVAVDNQSPLQGDEVTVTLKDVPAGKTADVTVGKAFGGTEVTVGKDASGTYTFTMPDYPVYINVTIQSSVTSPSSYLLTVETAGVAAGKVSFEVTGSNISGDASAGWQAEAGREVAVTLQTPPASKLTLTKTEAFAPDGSWRWTSLSGNAAVTTLTFTMPSTAVTVRFTIHEDTSIDPPVGPVNPPVEPDDPIYPDPDPDEPDIPVEPDDPATAVDPMAFPGLHIRTSAGTLRLIADYSGQATIYTFGGRMVAALRLETGVERQQALPRGAYILHSGNRSIKFTL